MSGWVLEEAKKAGEIFGQKRRLNIVTRIWGSKRRKRERANSPLLRVSIEYCYNMQNTCWVEWGKKIEWKYCLCLPIVYWAQKLSTVKLIFFFEEYLDLGQKCWI